MANEVGRRRTVPELPPQAPSLAIFSRSAESAIANLARNIVAVDAEETRNARPDPPRPDIYNPGDDLILVPARKRAKRDNNAPWMIYFACR